MQCIFPRSSTFNISVILLDDSEKFFKMPVNQKASATLYSIAKSIPVTSIEYFGLKYLDKFQKPHWINPERSLYKQMKKNQIEKSITATEKSILHFQVFFEVRYYPRDPTSINDEDFRYQIFLQIRKDLASNKLTIKEEKTISILCALVLQSDFGDYDSDRFAPHYIRQTIPNHLLTPNMEEQIKIEHIKFGGVEPVDAEYSFLEKVRWLENYGTTVFPVKDSANKNCYLGLNPQGFTLRYYKDAHLKCDIFWPRICAIRRNGRQFVIKEKSDKTIVHKFETGEKYLCKTLHKLALEHFAFFKLKKDDKPLVKEPPKRTFGKSSTREVGYSSDTSDNNQYSDDTFSSYPDSINTIQSAKLTKVFKKTITPIRNCASDVEEAVFSKKNRKVIVCKYQTETEDDNKDDLNDIGRQHHRQSRMVNTTAHDRIPADYIYENRLDSTPVNIHIRQKRLTKKMSTPASNDKRANQRKEVESPYRYSKTITEPTQEDIKYQTNYKTVRSREHEHQMARPRSGDSMDSKGRVRRKLPSTEMPIPMGQTVNQNECIVAERRIPGSTSVDSAMTFRAREASSSPTKRQLPQSPVTCGSPPVPKHRLPTNQRTEPNVTNRPQSLFNDGRVKPVFQNVPPRIPHRTNTNHRLSHDGPTDDVDETTHSGNKYYLNHVRRSVQETGI